RLGVASDGRRPRPAVCHALDALRANGRPLLEPTPLADQPLLDADVLRAVRALPRPHDLRACGAAWLGSLHEALLASARQQRRTRGGYYTPPGLVECLLDSALEPVIDEALGRADPEAAL